jgi:hypothetical protein
MTKAGYVVSFIGNEPGKALFVGLYKIGKTKPLTHAQYWKVPAYAELKKLGMTGFLKKSRASCLWFDLMLQDFYSSWKGKLIVDWPPPERSWWRLAHRNTMPVHAILEDSALDAAMKKWDELDLTWNQLSILPKRWQAKLAEWRGIYYIFDTSDRKGYVGSAYGPNNLLGRWQGMRPQVTAEIDCCRSAILSTFASQFSNWFHRPWTPMKLYVGKIHGRSGSTRVSRTDSTTTKASPAGIPVLRAGHLQGGQVL